MQVTAIASVTRSTDRLGRGTLELASPKRFRPLGSTALGGWPGCRRLHAPFKTRVGAQFVNPVVLGQGIDPASCKSSALVNLCSNLPFVHDSATFSY